MVDTPYEHDDETDQVPCQHYNVLVPALDVITSTGCAEQERPLEVICAVERVVQGLDNVRVLALETSRWEEQKAHVCLVSWRRRCWELDIRRGVLIGEYDAGDQDHTDYDGHPQDALPEASIVVANNCDGHEMCCARQQHHVCHNVVVMEHPFQYRRLIA